MRFGAAVRFHPLRSAPQTSPDISCKWYGINLVRRCGLPYRILDSANSGYLVHCPPCDWHHDVPLWSVSRRQQQPRRGHPAAHLHPFNYDVVLLSTAVTVHCHDGIPYTVTVLYYSMHMSHWTPQSVLSRLYNSWTTNSLYYVVALLVELVKYYKISSVLLAVYTFA